MTDMSVSLARALPLKRIKALYVTINALAFCFHLFRHAFMTTRLGFTAAQYGDTQVCLSFLNSDIHSRAVADNSCTSNS